MTDGNNTALGWAWSSRWEPLLRDAVLLSTKLERLGFTYYSGKVIVIERAAGRHNV